MTVLLDFQVRWENPSGRIFSHGMTISNGPVNFEAIASPIWVNVWRNGLQPGNKVRVMLINYHVSTYRGESSHREQQIFVEDLQYVEPHRFTGQFPEITVAFQLTDGDTLCRQDYWQELVVWINDELYKDPLTGQNIQLNLMETVARSNR